MGVLSLVLLVALVAILGLLWVGKTSEAMSFAQLIVTPVFTLTGAVTGFYFGSQQNSGR